MTPRLEYVRALHILALDAVENGLYDAWYRSLCRWYSREFSTPLMEVYDLSDEEVLRTYFEDHLWRLKESSSEESQEAYSSLRESIIKTPDELKAEIQEDDNWADQMINEIKEQEEQSSVAPPKTPKIQDDPNLIDGEQYSISGEDIDFIPEDFGE